MPRPAAPRRRVRLPLAAGTAASVLLLAACGGGAGAAGPSGEAGDGLDVVATTTQVQEFAQRVGGEHVAVTGLLRPGLSAHDVSPSPADLLAIGQADVVVRNGVGLEPWLDPALEAAGFDGLLVTAADRVPLRAPAVDEEAGFEGEAGHEGEAGSEGEAGHEGEAGGAEAEHTADDGHGHDGADPHVWQSPANAVLMVETIADGLAEADPENAPAYRENAASYVAELEALDAEVAAALADLPSRRVVTNHDALGYYLDRYGLELVGAVIPSFDSSAELSGAEIDDLVARIRESGAQAVLAEAALPPDAARTVAQEAGVAVVAGEDALYADSLGPAGSGAETYVAMVRHNTRVIAEALGG